MLALSDGALATLVRATRDLQPKERVWFLRDLGRRIDPDRVQRRRRNGRNAHVTIKASVDLGELSDFLRAHGIAIGDWDEDCKTLSTALEQLINQRWRYDL